MKKQKGFTAIEVSLVWIVVLIFGVYGWVSNIVKLIGMSFDPITTVLLVRVAGIFVAPLGAVAGYF